MGAGNQKPDLALGRHPLFAVGQNKSLTGCSFYVKWVSDYILYYRFKRMSIFLTGSILEVSKIVKLIS